MLAKCANPACSARFRYLHEGRLFAIESDTGSARIGLMSDPEYTGGRHRLQYFWLCSSCCRTMTLRASGELDIIVEGRAERQPNVCATENYDKTAAA
jgi:hypothetical protein